MNTPQQDLVFLQRAVELAHENVAKGGQPFGAVLVKDGAILADGVNEVYLDSDPTAHAEIQALRRAGHAHATPQFDGSVMYASGKPCAMCMSAMIVAGVNRIVYAAGDDMGEPYGWSTAALYQRMRAPFGEQGVQVEYLRNEGKLKAYEAWKRRHNL